MEDIEQEAEYWYDIYGLSENRDIPTIETFLSHFADRKKIEYIKEKLITLIPYVTLPEKHKLFESRYAPGDETRLRVPNNLKGNYNKLPEPERVWVKTLKEAIELGVSRRDQAFSIYFRNYIRKDIKCLLVHFTVDNKIILGVSVDEKDEAGLDNVIFAQKIKQEIEGVAPIKVSSVWYEQPPPDSEEEFLEAKDYLKALDKEKVELEKYKPYFWHSQEHSGYYHRYRENLHRRVRDIIHEPNLYDYYTLSDNQNQVLNIITSHGDHLELRKVQHPLAKDVIQLPFLGNLLHKSLSWGNKGFEPAKIHRVSIPPNAKTERIWQGHRDGVSDFTQFEGLRTSEIVIEDSFCLDKLDDLKRLAEDGFFQFEEGFFHYSNIQAYEEWLIKNQQLQLYLEILNAEKPLLKVNPITLLSLVEEQDWQQILSYIHQFKLDVKELQILLTEMCRTGSWQTWQVEDIFQMIPVTSFDIWYLCKTFHGNSNIELFKLLFLNRKEQCPLSHLIKGIEDSLLLITHKESMELAYFYLQVIEKEYGTFCNYSLILKLAGLEKSDIAPYLPLVQNKQKFDGLLSAVLRLLPQEEWHRNQLLNIALATENKYILEKLNLNPSTIDKIKQEEEALVENSKHNERARLLEAVIQGNYFQVAYLALRINPEHHAFSSEIGLASIKGMSGIVKILKETSHLC